jgi:hypothetical protein
MSTAKVILLVCLALFSPTLTFPQTVGPIQTSEDRLRTRLELVRGYLVAAGLHVPVKFDVEHLPELSAELRNWLDRQTALPTPRSEGDMTVPTQADVSGKAARLDADHLINDLHLTKGERVLRLWQYKAEAQEQPRTVVVGGNQELNPDHVLWRHSLMFKFSELSLSSADLASIYDSYGKLKNFSEKTADKDKLDLSQNPDCPNASTAATLIPCLRRVRTKDFFWRGLDGLTATVSMGQNPRFQQSGLLGPGQAEHLYSGEIDFDPTYLFPNGSNWSDVTKALGAFNLSSVTAKSLRTALSERCALEKGSQEEGDSDCYFKALLFPTNPTWRYKLLSAVIPTFTFKEQTQFDFIKNVGGEFVPPAFPNNHLWYVSFTTDLRRGVNVLKSKTDALDYVKVIQHKATKPLPECTVNSLPPATVGSLFLYALDDDDTSRIWKFTDEQSCSKKTGTPYRKPECTANGISIKKNGTLVGYPADQRDNQLNITVWDSSETKHQDCKVTLKIMQSATIANKFVLDYLEIAISHEVLLDDRWFDQFRETAASVLFSRSSGVESAMK